MAAPVRAVILALVPAFAAASFTGFTSGASCEANGAGSIRTLADCSAAAAALGLSDTTAEDDGQDGHASLPPYCFDFYGTLKFNSAGTNTGGCGITGSIYSTCICWLNAPPPPPQTFACPDLSGTAFSDRCAAQLDFVLLLDASSTSNSNS